MTTQRQSTRRANGKATRQPARKPDPIPEACKRGDHPLLRRIGKGCAACGKSDAW